MRDFDTKNDGGSAKRKNRGNRGQGGGSHGGASSGNHGGSYFGAGSSYNGGSSYTGGHQKDKPELCRRFNLGMCKNSKNNCTAGPNGTGHKLLHECSHRNRSGRWCRGDHPEIHHK
jgi:hypothetical protein